MNYPIAIHKDAKSDYGVTVPDLPGCFSAGRTLDEALAHAREAIEVHMEALVESGQAVPQPGKIETHQRSPDYRGATWALVGIDTANLRLNAVRINITVPERVLESIDRYAAEHGRTRSGLLVEAATAYLGHQPDSKTTKKLSNSARSGHGKRSRPAAPISARRRKRA